MRISQKTLNFQKKKKFFFQVSKFFNFPKSVTKKFPKKFELTEKLVFFSIFDSSEIWNFFRDFFPGIFLFKRNLKSRKNADFFTYFFFQKKIFFD